MAEVRVLVVDDEPAARFRLQRMVATVAGCMVCGEAANGEEALQCVAEHAPDVVLLDIRMPPPDGVEVARRLALLESPPAVIFCTAFDEYALPAFDAAAVDYLLKPISQQRLEQALARATKPSRAQLAQLTAARAPARDERIQVRSHRGLTLIPLDDIGCFLAEDKYVTVIHLGGEHIIDKPLRELELEYPGRFLRVHRSALVALSHLTGLEKIARGRYAIRLRGSERRIEVSRRQLPELRRLLREA